MLRRLSPAPGASPLPLRELAIVMEALGIGLVFQHALDPDGVPMRLQAEVLLRLLGGSPHVRPPSDELEPTPDAD